ncbi:MAG: glycoside hydrolase family 2 protein, partial [Gammaproteobacteria bacterium]|nr:glycoside hydrolase family 2 protein [Gammaproteobacteria bacterium]
LPHTWNANDTVDAVPGYRRDASWYRKVLPPAADQRLVLYFEGANMETDVYVNGRLAGRHVGGYVGFEVEITDYLEPDDDNLVMVRVSNAYNPNLIPSQKSDFFIHGGITRDVWLKKLPDDYIQRVWIDTPEVSHERASTTVIVLVDSAAADSAAMRLRASLLAPGGDTLGSKEVEVPGGSGAQTVDLQFEPLDQPQLWSPDSPRLYQVVAELLGEDDTVTHRVSEQFGYRWFEMRPQQGFFVNGERLLIRGTHRHEEHAGLGAALSNKQHRKDMQMIKDLGANFVRLGHYPQDPEVYRAADELGLILWDELPWCRGGKGGAEWEQNTEALWRAQIAQNRNHPSIAFWSLGNEIYWEEDFPGGGASEVINPYLEKLNKLTKELDPSRLTTIRKYYPGAHIVDAFSPSIWAGWYGGSYGQYEQALKDSMQKYPTLLHMEYGGSSHVGRHTEDPIDKDGIPGGQVTVAEAMNQAVVKSVAKDSDWNENYIVDLFDWHLRVSESLPGFAGNAQWAFKDFGTPLRPENPIPYVNQKGLVDREGKPKDAYYVFASYWSKDPFCYIESKTWTHRSGPQEGRDVTVYCNTEEAELYLDGESLGRNTRDPQSFPAGGLVWEVPFVDGPNELSVEGFINGEQVATDNLQVTYVVGGHGKFQDLILTQKDLGDNRVLITAEAVDADGNRVLDFSDRAYFSTLGGDGRLLENYGTPTKSSIIEMANGYAAIEFERGEQATTVESKAQNIKGRFIEIGGR